MAASADFCSFCTVVIARHATNPNFSLLLDFELYKMKKVQFENNVDHGGDQAAAAMVRSCCTSLLPMTHEI
jgi:hypothetical protein